MVSTCRKAGVKVYVDAVINHMTGQGDTSYGGKHYSHFDYPDEGWTAADFHHLGDQCNSTTGGIDDFNNLRQVFNCELVGLADLDTGAARVRNKLAAYLNKLIGYGVSGFRVDAGKHVGQTDLDAIYRRLHRTKEGTKPYWALEVFGGGPGTLSPQAFTRGGNVLGLDAVKQLRDAFKSYPDAHVGSIAVLKDFGAGSGLTPSRKTLSFVQNHDTERNGDALNYKDGARNILANQYLLASGYGRPQVYSGFAFTTNDDSPPATAAGSSPTPTAPTAGCASTETRASRHSSRSTTTSAMRPSVTGGTTGRTSSRSAAATWGGRRSTTAPPPSRSPCRPGCARAPTATPSAVAPAAAPEPRSWSPDPAAPR